MFVALQYSCSSQRLFVNLVHPSSGGMSSVSLQRLVQLGRMQVYASASLIRLVHVCKMFSVIQNTAVPHVSHMKLFMLRAGQVPCSVLTMLVKAKLQPEGHQLQCSICCWWGPHTSCPVARSTTL